jgi:pimeloyl-ACP methyl ester carboxylesterase
VLFIAGRGHGPFRDDPERVWAVVRRWMAGLAG